MFHKLTKDLPKNVKETSQADFKVKNLYCLTHGDVPDLCIIPSTTLIVIHKKILNFFNKSRKLTSSKWSH